jgi:hypothetical protein
MGYGFYCLCSTRKEQTDVLVRGAQSWLPASQIIHSCHVAMESSCPLKYETDNHLSSHLVKYQRVKRTRRILEHLPCNSLVGVVWIQTRKACRSLLPGPFRLPVWCEIFSSSRGSNQAQSLIVSCTCPGTGRIDLIPAKGKPVRPGKHGKRPDVDVATVCFKKTLDET